MCLFNTAEGFSPIIKLKGPSRLHQLPNKKTAYWIRSSSYLVWISTPYLFIDLRPKIIWHDLYVLSLIVYLQNSLTNIENGQCLIDRVWMTIAFHRNLTKLRKARKADSLGCHLFIFDGHRQLSVTTPVWLADWLIFNCDINNILC